MSRLLARALLMKEGYRWIAYTSLEKEIERRKDEYFRILRECLRNRPGEDIRAWVEFFLDCLISQQNELKGKITQKGSFAGMSSREKMIHAFVSHRPHCLSAEISTHLDIPLPSVKRILGIMCENGYIRKLGKGRATTYTN
jgi:Fic family protein